MSEHIKRLLNQVISAAKARGISQAQLANRAGMTAVGLSKAKRRGDIRASTLEALGGHLELELIFTPRQSKEQVVQAIKSGVFFKPKTTDDAEDRE